MLGHTCASCRSHQTHTVDVTTHGDGEQHFLVSELHEDGTVDTSVPAEEITEPYDEPEVDSDA